MSKMQGKKRILITGITGFLGSHVGKIFLERLSEKYVIRGGVRDILNEKKLQPLKDAYGDLYQLLELVNFDVGNEA